MPVLYQNAQKIAIEKLIDGLLQWFQEKLPPTRTKPDWTKAVYGSLRDLGRDFGCDVYCSDASPEYPEYLVDVLWWNRTTCRADLVCECEWKGGGDVAFDFEKLLYLKSPLKVMICDEQRKLLDRLVAKSERFPDHVQGERYLLILLKSHPEGGVANCLEWIVPATGPVQSSVEFKPIENSPLQYKLATPPSSFG